MKRLGLIVSSSSPRPICVHKIITVVQKNLGFVSPCAIRKHSLFLCSEPEVWEKDIEIAAVFSANAHANQSRRRLQASHVFQKQSLREQQNLPSQNCHLSQNDTEVLHFDNHRLQRRHPVSEKESENI